MESCNHEPNADIDAALEKIGQIDLSKINKKLHYDDPDYWNYERLAEAEVAYRRFLALNLLYPGEILAVNRILDNYWHNHILDTRKYAEDCDQIFGFFLHHYPYFGLPGEEDEGQNIPAFAVTQRIWEEAFGTPLVSETKPGLEPRLTLDRVLNSLPRADDGPDAGPKGCKNGQHCQKVIAPVEIEGIESIAAVLIPVLDQ